MTAYDDLARAAREVLNPAVWAYYEAGAGDQVTRDEATAAWRKHRLAARVLRAVGRPDRSVTLLGHRYATPIGIAPTAMQRLANDAGELAMVAAAGELGAPACVPFLSGHRFADIGALSLPWWLQVYVASDPGATERVVGDAIAAGASALVITVDTPVVGRKPTVEESEWPHDLSPWHAVNLPDQPSTELTRWSPSLGVDVIERLARFGVPVVVKGVLRADDAAACVEAGARAVWVSTHGGRQLDRCVPSATALPEIRARLGADAEIYVDGGVRDALDMLTAMALGADAVFLGRPALYALATGGRAGVVRLLGELNDELSEAMLLSGCREIADCAGLINEQLTAAEAPVSADLQPCDPTHAVSI